jgi:trimethylamine-N-oxide reductase (cytochrome c)
VKDVPEPMPLPGQYSGQFGQDLPTQSGKIEFVPSSLRRIESLDPDRPAVNRYIPSWEGVSCEAASLFPLQLVTAHPRYSFHTYNDGKDSAITRVADHRIEVGGRRYWIISVSEEDARTRGIAQHELVRVYNARGAVICAAAISPMVRSGVVRAYESCAEYEPVDTGQGPVDLGGCLNLLTPARTMSTTADGIAPNSCLVQIERWQQAGRVSAEVMQ